MMNTLIAPLLSRRVAAVHAPHSHASLTDGDGLIETKTSERVDFHSVERTQAESAFTLAQHEERHIRQRFAQWDRLSDLGEFESSTISHLHLPSQHYFL